MRVGSWRSRPIGASIRPARERGRPRTSARYSRDELRARRRSRWSRRCASSERATTSSPDVSRSSRWTMPGPLGLLPARDRVREQAVDERAVRVAGRRVDDDAGRLVDDEQVLVLAGDPQVDLLGLERWSRGARAPRARRLLAARRAGGSSAALHRRRAPRPSPSRRSAAAREPTSSQRREEAVEPLAGRLGRHDELQLSSACVLGAVRRSRGCALGGDERRQQDRRRRRR